MKTKSKKTKNNCTSYSPFDLFGEIPVTENEIDLWCEAVPKIKSGWWRKDWYIQNWDVIGKIRAAKLLMPLEEYLGLSG